MAVRLRAALADLERERRVLVFAHDAIVLLTRYIVERAPLNAAVANGSISVWSRDGGGFRPVTFNSTGHLRGDSPSTLVSRGR